MALKGTPMYYWEAYEAPAGHNKKTIRHQTHYRATSGDYGFRTNTMIMNGVFTLGERNLAVWLLYEVFFIENKVFAESSPLTISYINTSIRNIVKNKHW